jgi:hypothetical protein
MVATFPAAPRSFAAKLALGASMGLTERTLALGTGFFLGYMP